MLTINHSNGRFVLSPALFYFAFMRTYFTRLFNYDRYANETIVDAIVQAGVLGNSVALMSHLLVAQQIWLNRCKGLPAAGGALWPDWQTAALPAVIAENNKEWLNYLETLQPEDFETTISYKNSKGDHFESKLTDILTHLINHGTHHRAQIGQQLKFAGADQLPNTDYIFYIRGLNS